MKKLLLVITILACASAPLYASEEADVQKLEPIVVTPSRYEEEAIDVGKNVTVIDQEAIERSMAKTVPELLKSETGIYVRDYLGNGKTAHVDIRGFGETGPSNTLVLIDGRRTNQIDLSGTDWSQINIDSIERIEIVRGAQSVVYGDNAVGGVINIITKKGVGKKPEIGLGYRVGTYDYSAYSAYVSGGTPFMDYYGGFTQSDTDGHRLNNNLEVIDFTGSLIAKPTRDLNIRLLSGYHKDWYGMPGALSLQNLNRLGWKGSIYPNDKGKTEDSYIMTGPEYTLLSKCGEFVFSGDFIARNRRTASVFPATPWENNNHIVTIGLTPKANFKGDIFGALNKIVAGVDFYSYKNNILSGAQPTKDIVVIEQKNLGFYAEDTVEIIKNVAANFGARLEWAFDKFDQQAMIQGVSRKKMPEWALDAGLNYKYNDRSAVYANYARSFRYPAIDEWYSVMWSFWGFTGGGLNLNLEPQTGNHFEVGIKENTLKWVSANADYFVTDLRHELYYDPLTFTNSIYDHTMRHGAELDCHVYPVKELDLSFRYTLEKAFFVGSHYAGNEIPMVPRDKLALGVSYVFMDCVTINYIMNYVGARHMISDMQNTAARMDSYATHDLKMSYNKYGFELFIAINNLLDERYSEYGVVTRDANNNVNNVNYYPSPGRNVILGSKYSF